MSNPIFDMMRPSAASQGNMIQSIMNFAKTVQGNPEQIVRGLVSSGRMTQQQFEQYSTIARQMMPPNK